MRRRRPQRRPPTRRPPPPGREEGRPLRQPPPTARRPPRPGPRPAPGPAHQPEQTNGDSPVRLGAVSLLQPPGVGWLTHGQPRFRPPPSEVGAGPARFQPTARPTGGLLQGPTVALEAPLQRPPLPASHRDRLFGVP